MTTNLSECLICLDTIDEHQGENTSPAVFCHGNYHTYHSNCWKTWCLHTMKQRRSADQLADCFYCKSPVEFKRDRKFRKKQRRIRQQFPPKSNIPLSFRARRRRANANGLDICPRCDTQIIKEGGCNVMTCRCGHRFVYQGRDFYEPMKLKKPLDFIFIGQLTMIMMFWVSFSIGLAKIFDISFLESIGLQLAFVCIVIVMLFTIDELHRRRYLSFLNIRRAFTISICAFMCTITQKIVHPHYHPCVILISILLIFPVNNIETMIDTIIRIRSAPVRRIGRF
jgi:hypothetical protein